MEQRHTEIMNSLVWWGHRVFETKIKRTLEKLIWILIDDMRIICLI